MLSENQNAGVETANNDIEMAVEDVEIDSIKESSASENNQ